MLGLLNVHKPSGITSRGVVNHVQELVRPEKVGHAGTLDPLAQGVLMVCVGAATRLVEYLQQMPKWYLAEFRLGCRSDTDDAQGNVVEIVGSVQPDQGAIEAAIPRFIGEIQQTPPVYSAVKVKGRRSYAIARRGESVALEPRTVVVYRITIRRYEYPALQLEIECGSGTYIRAIGRDLGQLLGTGAVMTGLTRTAIGSFRVADAVPLASLTRETLPQQLIPARRALDGRPQIALTSEEYLRVTRGQLLDRVNHGLQGPIAAMNVVDELIAVVCPRNADQLHPAVVLAGGT
jgi:tRNA pseudouridine55 synthase